MVVFVHIVSLALVLFFFDCGFSSIGVNHDPGRIAAQVVTGMEFLRAGAMIKFNGNVKGLTTAAGMWVATAIGLMFSAGMYVAAIVAAVFSYLTLDFHRLFPRLFSVTKISHPTDESIESDERLKHCDDHDFYHEDHDRCFT
ncbi:MgtC/SapB family protein [Brevibacillus formosus]|uniref:MgtC/SapB/SrpB/YhiD N-terminal domain-containing protein n=1 Tax=Brevibacillus formosus TaxID=54913 RepID=A0ABQ0T1Z7_9BACL|nr:MgtC/SapB family protein [Brevibacillus formosus]MED1956866.1 MgtC/SapB family protein [Brevibacillus formosus]GED57265.1 hypothetical protein BFO01nite_13970 [Brevibacillus formosus]